MFLDLIEPYWYTEEALAIGQIEDHDDAVSTLVICIRDRTVALLPRSVPYLELNRRLIDLHCPESEIHPDRANVVLLKAIVLFEKHVDHQMVNNSNKQAIIESFKINKWLLLRSITYCESDE